MATKKRKGIKVCDTPEDSCAIKDTTESGKYPVVSDKETNCNKDLVQEQQQYPAILVVTDQGNTELRSGAEQSPIPLDHLQIQVGGKIKEICIINEAGELVKFTIPLNCGKFKLVFENGTAKLVEDTLPEFISDDICEVGCSEFDFFLAVKQTNIICGDTIKTSYQLCKVDKSCIPYCPY